MHMTNYINIYHTSSSQSRELALVLLVGGRVYFGSIEEKIV